MELDEKLRAIYSLQSGIRHDHKDNKNARSFGEAAHVVVTFFSEFLGVNHIRHSQIDLVRKNTVNRLWSNINSSFKTDPVSPEEKLLAYQVIIKEMCSNNDLAAKEADYILFDIADAKNKKTDSLLRPNFKDAQPGAEGTVEYENAARMITNYDVPHTQIYDHGIAPL